MMNKALQGRKRLLIRELQSCGLLSNKNVLGAFKKVPRENFVLPKYRKYAYVNEPLPLPEGQTISQPFTVVSMTEALDAAPGQKVLEVGSGSGYQAAILSEIVGNKGKVVTMEIIAKLKEFAEKNLSGYKNVEVILGDGSEGFPREAPYDRMIVTASAKAVPEKLVEQLKDGGTMVIPVGEEMYVIKKKGKALEKTMIGYYAFVPLTGATGAAPL